MKRKISRDPQMYFKKSHRKFFVNLKDGRQVALSADPEEARKLYLELLLNDKPVTKSTPIRQLIKQFLSDKKKNAADSTWKFYRDSLKSFNEKLGHIPIDELRKSHITEWIKVYADLSDNYRHNLMRACKACFRWAVESELIDKMPQFPKAPPATGREVSRDFIDNWESILSQATGDLSDFLTVLSETGARPQELRQVCAHHIRDQGFEIPAKEAKGKRDIRIIILNKKALPIVERLALRRPTGPLFLLRGRKISKESLSREIKTFSEKVGIPFSAYQCRHLFATRALEKGNDSLSVSIAMGHRSLRCVSEIYQHVNRRSDLIRKVFED